MTVKTSISLSDQQDAFARQLVDEGRYASVSAVIQQGLDLLRQKTEHDELERAALRALLEQRRQGPFISGAEMDQRLKRALRAKRTRRGA